MHYTLKAVRSVSRLVVVGVTTVAALTATAVAYAGGIDVSHWQGTINWSKVDDAGVQFAFLKATEGTYYVDTKFAANWSAAKAEGIYRGSYHFAQPGKSSGTDQAKYYVNQVGLSRFKETGSFPPVLDLETTGGLGVSALRTWVTNFLTTTKSLTGRTPILYFSPGFWSAHMGSSTGFTQYPLWIAHYTTASAPTIPAGWSRWTFWQYTSSGTVAGIAGNVDRNKFNGTTAALADLANTTGGSTTTPVPPGPTVPGTAPTTLSATASASSVTIGGSVKVSGKLVQTPATGATTSAAVPSAAVGLYARKVGTTTWSKVASATTSTTGGYAVSTKVAAATDYQVKYAGSTTYSPSASPVRRVTATRIASLATLAKDTTATTIVAGHSVMLYGHLTTATSTINGASVKIYKRSVDGTSWIYLRTMTSKSPTGWYDTVFKPTRTRTFKVVYAGSSRYTPVTSKLLTVTVR